jgi:hypothetical protein
MTTFIQATANGLLLGLIYTAIAEWATLTTPITPSVNDSPAAIAV